MKIPADEFRRLLADPDVPDRELRPYLRVAEALSGPFRPTVQADPDKVALSEVDAAFENALAIGNGFSRWRRRQRFRKRLKAGDPAPVLVSEGDSWFQFPFLIDDVIDHLEADHLIWSSGAAGDTAENMVFTRPEYFAALEAQATSVRAFLFSGAGNDVIGEDADGEPVLARLVRPATDGAAASDLIDGAALATTMDTIGRAYREVLRRLRADDRFATLPVILHGYDYCFPGAPDDARRPLYAAPDQWLGRALRAKGVTDPATQRGIITLLIDRLYELLAEIAGEDEAGAVHVVDVRGAMPAIADWADEIHGTDDGFAKVAERFRRTIDAAIGVDRRSAFARSRRPERATAGHRAATIVVDPGHGGERTIGGSSPNNATGPRGTLEKTLTLAVAQRLRDELVARGHRVLMTRASDRNRGLADRATLARQEQADVFLSIHFNGWVHPGVQGTETYHHPAASSGCQELARTVQDRVLAVTGLRDRGVKEGAFGVLRPSRHDPITASALCEVSFLTDPVEEARLADEAYRLRIALGLADGIERYLDEAHRANAGELERVHRDGDTEWEDGKHLGEAEPARATRDLRVPLARPLNERALTEGAAGLELEGFTDAERFLGAWREQRRRERGVEPTARFERRIGADDTLPASFLASGAACAAAVCKIEAAGVDFRGQLGAWVGTGFLVAPNLLLTNHHVLNSADVAREARAVFAYEMRPKGGFAAPRSYTLDPDSLFLTSPADDGLDFTFVHVLGEAHEDFGWIEMNRGSFVIAPGERANLVHHPEGSPKRVSLRANRSIDFDELLLHYVSDTESGSSGAPVFDDLWRLIALHHAWAELPAHVPPIEGFPAHYVNEGIKLSAIVIDLEARLQDPREAAWAWKVLQQVHGSDSITGYFGAVGRRAVGATGHPRERAASLYRGGTQDVDLAAWDVAWFAQAPHDRAAATATVFADLNLDIWVLANCPPAAGEILQRRLAADFGQAVATHCLPELAIAIVWNPETVQGDGSAPGAPAAFRFSVPQRVRDGLEPYRFCIVPCADRDPRPAEQLARCALACREGPAGVDAILAGLERQEAVLRTLAFAGVEAVAAQDPAVGAMAVVPAHRSLLDAVYVPPSMSQLLGASDRVRTTADGESLEQVRRLTGYRPLMVRLALRSEAPTADEPPAPARHPAESPAAAPVAEGEAEALLREFLSWRASRRDDVDEEGA